MKVYYTIISQPERRNLELKKKAYRIYEELLQITKKNTITQQKNKQKTDTRLEEMLMNNK